MNRHIILFTIACGMLLLTTTNIAFGQLKVKGSVGKVIIGQDRSDDPHEDEYEKLSASIFGRQGYYKSGGKLAFGDFGRYDHWGWNVFIGEWSNLDSDKLWLHGKNGFVLTYGRGDDNYKILSFDVSNNLGLCVNTEVIAQGLKIPTDSKVQKDATCIKNSYDRITKLDGLTYKYTPYNLALSSSNISRPSTTISSIDTSSAKSESLQNSVLGQDSSQSSSNTDKEVTDEAFFNTWDKQMKDYAPQKNGFDAQQVKELFPELVETDVNGNTYVDYIGLIPVLVQAMKEQSSIVRAQSLKIKELELNTDSVCLNTNFSDSSSISSDSNTKKLLMNNNNENVLANAFLYQNTPNPFNTITEIKYFLPEGTTNAHIYIFNLQGTMLLSYILGSNNGFGSITINASELNSGMYLYSLVIGDKQVETKRMIITNN